MKRFRETVWILLGLAMLALIFVALFAMHPRAPNRALNGLEPIGGPSIAQDVNTLVGQRARPFSLRDAGGQMHTVVPGQGHAILLISHMGRY